MIWIKNRSKTSQFAVYYGDNTDYLALNDADPTADYAGYWNDTSPTSTVFSVGSDGDVHGASGENVIAYCFHSVDGYSKVGSYEGNDDADGTFIYLGFRPAFVIVKNIDTGNNWMMADTKREIHNPMADELYPDLSNAEYISSGQRWDFVSNGIKLRSGSAVTNENTHIYIAFAETPFKYSNAR